MRIALLTLLIVALSPTVRAAELPPEWSRCKAGSDCVVVASSCGKSVGVHMRYQAQAHAEICKTEDCSGTCDAAVEQADRALCAKGVCVPIISRARMQ